jgi:hypothetical protein
MALPAVERRNFKIGKYDIVAQPALGSAHMLRYTVMLNGKRLGALLSVPTESDCKFLECPPAVPPVKIFQVTHRPGRPKKNAAPPVAQSLSENNHQRGLRHDDLPPGTLPIDLKRSE